MGLWNPAARAGIPLVGPDEIASFFRARRRRGGGQAAAIMRPVSSAPEPGVRPQILEAFERSWAELARPGAWWTAEERVAIAEIARAAVSAAGARHAAAALPQRAVDAATVIASTPGQTSEGWVSDVCEAIGELPYVELVGIVARVAAIDTFHRLAAWPLTALPEPEPGEPTHEPPPEGARKNRTWVSMVMPSAPFVLGAVPSALTAMNDLTDVLYMPMNEMSDPDWRRGELHRTQVELVAASTSHVNECFY